KTIQAPKIVIALQPDPCSNRPKDQQTPATSLFRLHKYRHRPPTRCVAQDVTTGGAASSPYGPAYGDWEAPAWSGSRTRQTPDSERASKRRLPERRCGGRYGGARRAGTPWILGQARWRS